MNPARRQYLLHIALLCVAVLFSHTARATTCVDAVHHCALRSSIKVAAEAPSTQNKFAVKVKKTIRQPFAFGAGDPLLSPCSALMFTRQQTLQALFASQTLYNAAPSRLFVLRI